LGAAVFRFRHIQNRSDYMGRCRPQAFWICFRRDVFQGDF